MLKARKDRNTEVKANNPTYQKEHIITCDSMLLAHRVHQIIRTVQWTLKQRERRCYEIDLPPKHLIIWNICAITRQTAKMA